MTYSQTLVVGGASQAAGTNLATWDRVYAFDESMPARAVVCDYRADLPFGRAWSDKPRTEGTSDHEKQAEGSRYFPCLLVVRGRQLLISCCLGGALTQ